MAVDRRGQGQLELFGSALIGQAGDITAQYARDDRESPEAMQKFTVSITREIEADTAEEAALLVYQELLKQTRHRFAIWSRTRRRGREL